MMSPADPCRSPGWRGARRVLEGVGRRAVSDPWTLGGPGRPAAGRAGTAKAAPPAGGVAGARQPRGGPGPPHRGAVGGATARAGDRLAAGLHLEPAPGV